jgi:uncharacterized protein (TIGR02145 family)
VPSDAEWSILMEYLGGYTTAGGKMKETGTTHWISPNMGADNSSGFTGLPGGDRINTGTYLNQGTGGWFWSTTAFSISNASFWGLSSTYSQLSAYNDKKVCGVSVRCLKD